MVLTDFACAAALYANRIQTMPLACWGVIASG